MGIVDHARKRIEIAMTLPGPPDSVSRVSGFERGVEGLAELVSSVVARSAGQLVYLGEWHTHPPGAGSQPSATDMATLQEAARDRRDEACPAIMMIAGGDGSINIQLEIAT